MGANLARKHTNNLFEIVPLTAVCEPFNFVVALEAPSCLSRKTWKAIYYKVMTVLWWSAVCVIRKMKKGWKWPTRRNVPLAIWSACNQPCHLVYGSSECSRLSWLFEWLPSNTFTVFSRYWLEYVFITVKVKQNLCLIGIFLSRISTDVRKHKQVRPMTIFVSMWNLCIDPRDILAYMFSDMNAFSGHRKLAWEILHVLDAYLLQHTDDSNHQLVMELSRSLIVSHSLRQWHKVFSQL